MRFSLQPNPKAALGIQAAADGGVSRARPQLSRTLPHVTSVTSDREGSALELSLIQPMAELQELHKDPHNSKHTSLSAKQRELGPGGRKYNSDGSLCPAEAGRARVRGRWTRNGPGPADIATWGLSPPDPENRKLTDPATKCGGLKGQQESWVPRIMVAKQWPKDSGDFIHNRAAGRRPF